MLTKQQKQVVLRAMEDHDINHPQRSVSYHDAITIYIPMIKKHDAMFGLKCFDSKEEHILGLALFLAADGEL